MQALGRGQRSDLNHPALSVFTPIDGVLDDVDVVEFVILDRSGDAPVQAFPEAGRAVSKGGQTDPARGGQTDPVMAAKRTPTLTANAARHAGRPN